MVNYDDHEALFSALSNGTRRSILDTLRKGPRPISELAEPFDISLVAVSKHVHVLEDAGLLQIQRHGRTRVCRLEPAPLESGLRWMARFATFWQEELDQIERFLDSEPAPVGRRWEPDPEEGPDDR